MKAIHIYSGGLDSTVLLYHLLQKTDSVMSISFNYGQKHIKELECAKTITTLLKIPHRIVDLRSLSDIFGKNSLTSGENVPEGHYTEEIMKSTVVPNRNMIMVSIAAALAISSNYDTLSYGAHSGDHAIYPDCRPEFVKSLDESLSLCDWTKLQLYCPFINLSKGEIVAIGKKLKVPFEKTWTCYNGLNEPCGKCASCVEREESFK